MTDNITPDNTEANVAQVTPDNTEENGGNGPDLSEVGKDFEENGRKAKLVTKEVGKYAEFLVDGTVDYDGIKSIYRGNSVSDAALAKFCADNGLNVDEVKGNLVNPVDEKIKALEAKIEGLEAGNNPEPTFTDVLKTQLEAAGLSQNEFLKYKDEFEEELEDLQGLTTDVAISKALRYVLKGRTAVKLVKSDAPKGGTQTGIMTKAEYEGFLNTRSAKVGNDQAVKDLDAYEAERKAKGEPFFQ